MIKRLKIIFLTIPLLILNQITLCQVDSGSVKPVFDVSLSELTNFDITVASKNPENILEAPGVITAYSSKELDYMGYYTIRDLADITPGYSSYRSIGEITLETRGQKAAGFDNNKHLLLIDGIPIYHARAGKVNTEEDLLLYFSKQVEFLRGPGSALYGVGAFYGVINVVPKDVGDIKNITVESKMSVGMPNFRRRVMGNIIVPHELGVSTMNFGYAAKEASLSFLGRDSVNQNSLNRDNSNSLFLRFSHHFDKGELRGVKLGFISNSKVGGLGDYWNSFQNPTRETLELSWSQLSPFVKYNRKISEEFSINSYVLGNVSTEKGTTGVGAVAPDSSIMSLYQIKIYDFEALGEVSYTPDFEKLKNSLNIRFGLNYVSRYQAGAPFSYANFVMINKDPFVRRDTLLYNEKSDSYHIYSSYIQLQKKIKGLLKGTTVTLGGRYDGVSILGVDDKKQINYFDRFSPRIAVVQKITDNLVFKALYGSALRAPLLKIRWVNLEALTKHPSYEDSISTNLQPETIQSAEFSIGYNSSRFNGTVTYFCNKTVNNIIKAPVGDIGSVYSNSSAAITAYGSEVELSWSPRTKRVKFKANWSFAVPTTSDNVNNLDVPIHKINGVFYLNFNKKIPLTLGLSHHYIVGFRTPNGKSNGVQSTDVNIRYLVNPQFTLELLSRNIFNIKYYYPSFDGSGRGSVQGDIRSFLLSLNFTY